MSPIRNTARKRRTSKGGVRGSQLTRSPERRTKQYPKNPLPAQEQEKPGHEHELTPKPQYEAPAYKAAGKLEGKTALITGGDSGIGRAVAVLYAKEGADVAITYLPEEARDAEETKQAVEAEGRRCLTLEGDLTDPDFCDHIVERTLQEFGQLDILVNNAAFQQHQDSLDELSDEQWDHTFRTNIYGYFRVTKAALPHLKEGASIINTGSETGLFGSKALLDYSATKGAIVAFTRSLALALADQGIRVNGVAPGPIWTPLIPASFKPKKVAEHGNSAPMERAGQPNEVAPCYVFLASEEASYISGQVLHVNGGKVVGS